MEHINDPASLAEHLAGTGRWQEAAAAYAHLVALGHSDYQLHYNYGTVLMRCSRFEEGCEQMTAALTYLPDSLDALNNLAAAQIKLGNPCSAEAACRSILALRADHPMAWTNLGQALCNQGRVPEGLEALQHALELDPACAEARESLLLNLNYIATDGQGVSDLHHMLCSDLPSRPRKPPPVIAGRRIRVGYVSSDFRRHAVAFFMLGVIGTHDKKAFEVFCYSTTQAQDRRTDDFRLLAEHFVDLSAQSDTEAAQRIEADLIDILVDLGGHTSGGRLGIFALRPAPIQVTYLGYPATTGCSFIDYRLVDSLTDPEGNPACATESLFRLPAPFLCYYPDANSPDTGSIPALANGHITFGSFNHSSKLSEDTIALWSRVLHAVPHSRMHIKARAFSETAVSDRFRKQFLLAGIHEERLTFSGLLAGHQEHLTTYGKVDIALDTFPYNGTTTTCEALWMGVPVISLVGDLHATRVGLTILNSVGLGGFAASSAEEYVALAVALAANKSHLVNLRSHLRRLVLQSPLCDRFRLTRGLEDAYRQMLKAVAIK